MVAVGTYMQPTNRPLPESKWDLQRWQGEGV